MELRWKLRQELSDILRLCPSQSNFLPMTTQKYIWINFFLKTICREQRGVACECYKRACEMDGSYVFRGNLDPEITLLIKKFGLNKELGL